MNTQPEALKIIQHMDDEWQEDWDGKRIRKELRRLHAANIDCLDNFDALMEERNLLRAANQELLEALKLADALLRGANMNALIVERKVEAALAKHSKENT